MASKSLIAFIIGIHTVKSLPKEDMACVEVQQVSGGAEKEGEVKSGQYAKYVPGLKIYTLPAIDELVQLTAIFPNGNPIEIDLGAGDGGFIVEYAKLHPERNFIAVERLLGRLRKIDKKVQRLGLQNLIAIRIEAMYFVRYLLPPDSVTAIHIYFPDPWPRKKHQRRRLIQPIFVEAAYRVLCNGGRVYLRTDDPSYFQQMLCCFGAHPGFRQVDTPPELMQVLTDFEKQFVALGKEIYRCAYEKCVTST